MSMTLPPRITAPFAHALDLFLDPPRAGAEELTCTYRNERLLEQAKVEELKPVILGVFDHMSGLLAVAHAHYKVVLPTLSMNAVFNALPSALTQLEFRVRIVNTSETLVRIQGDCFDGGSTIATASLTFTLTNMPLSPAVQSEDLQQTTEGGVALADIYLVSPRNSNGSYSLNYEERCLGNVQHRLYHGGYLVGVLTKTAALSLSDSGYTTPSVCESKTHFLKPVVGGSAIATVKHLPFGRRSLLAEVSLYQDADLAKVLVKHDVLVAVR